MGSWAFLIGVILAIIFGFFEEFTWVGWLLLLLGIVVGLLNITDVEIKPFLYAGAVLVIVSALGGVAFSNLNLGFMGKILNNMLVMFVPATIVVALKSVFSLAKK